MRNDYDPNYLAHSKGPWKKHKYIKKVGNRYYYAGSKGYYKALATDPDAKYSSSKSQRDAAKRINARRATSESLNRAKKKSDTQKRVNAVKSGVKRAGAAVADTANRFTNKSRRTATMRVAKRAVANSKAGKAVRKAAWRTGLAVSNKSRQARRKTQVSAMKALNSIRSARKKGAAAINNLISKTKKAALKRKNDRTWAGNLKRARKKANSSKR